MGNALTIGDVVLVLDDFYNVKIELVRPTLSFRFNPSSRSSKASSTWQKDNRGYLERSSTWQKDNRGYLKHSSSWQKDNRGYLERSSTWQSRYPRVSRTELEPTIQIPGGISNRARADDPDTRGYLELSSS